MLKIIPDYLANVYIKSAIRKARIIVSNLFVLRKVVVQKDGYLVYYHYEGLTR